jgi:nicotinate-nucleotide adenylyltransferase
VRAAATAGAAARCRRLRRLPGWHRWQSLFDLAHLAVAHRPGFAIDAGRNCRRAGERCYRDRFCASPASLAESPAGRIVTFAMTQLAISATQIRAAAGQRPQCPLPAARHVIAYIRQQHLYPEY